MSDTQKLYIPKHLAKVIIALADVCMGEGQYGGDDQSELFDYIADAYPDLAKDMWWHEA